MKILILDWRDPQNPTSGGAEVVMFRYAQHWITLGHQVWWLGNKFSSANSETVAGITIVRIGPQLPYHNTVSMLIAYPLFILNAVISGWCLSRSLNPDLTIDAIHGLPMFSFFYARGRKILWVCEVAGKIWDKMYPFPISIIGRLLEGLIYLLYAKYEVWSISQSTKRDILALNSRLAVSVVPLGIDTAKFKPQPKFPYPSALFVARLVKMKGIESALAAARTIAQKLPNFKLYVVGGGNSLYAITSQPNVEFLGRAPDAVRNLLYARCHFLLHPSFKEGFGLTVLEAAASGTPTIARSGSALDELITHGKNGLMFDSDKEIGQLFLNYYGTTKYSNLTKLAKLNSTGFDWANILAKSSIVTHI